MKTGDEWDMNGNGFSVFHQLLTTIVGFSAGLFHHFKGVFKHQSSNFWE